MILATWKNGSRDGELLVVAQDRKRAQSAAPVATSLQLALENWANARKHLERLSDELSSGIGRGGSPLPPLHAPLPRAYAWLDGSAYLNHVVLARRARGVEPPPDLIHVPLMYQGGSDHFLAPDEPLIFAQADYGIDFEAELAVVTTDVPRGVSPESALDHVALLLLCNDVTLRNLVPAEIGRGFGFLQSKPPTAFAPFALTPDELGPAWREGKAFLRLKTYVNLAETGDLDTGAEMHFNFGELISHAAKTRPLCAGTIIGGGTVSMEDPSRGAACLAEKRMREVVSGGSARTQFLGNGDRVRIEAFLGDRSLFGAIEQEVRIS